MAASAQTSITALNRLLDQFGTVDARNKDPKGYQVALDEAVKETSFKNVLQCTVKLSEDPDKLFEVIFIDPNAADQTMSVSADEATAKNGKKVAAYRLHLSTKTAVEWVLFTYIHEMTHVCQIPNRAVIERRVIQKKISLDALELEFKQKLERNGVRSGAKRLLFANAELEKSQAALMQNRFLGEIEAFQNMDSAYAETVLINPRFCRARTDADPEALYRGYIQSAKEHESGIFAQAVVWGYLDRLKPELSHLFNLQSNKRAYFFPTAGKFAYMHQLSPEFRNQVQSLGVSIKETGGE